MWRRWRFEKPACIHGGDFVSDVKTSTRAVPHAGYFILRTPLPELIRVHRCYKQLQLSSTREKTEQKKKEKPMTVKTFETLNDSQINALIALQFFKYPAIVALGEKKLEVAFEDGNDIPQYSNDIEAAWLIVDKLLEEEIDVKLNYEFEQEAWRCTVNGQASLSSEPAMAICSSALKHIGVLEN